MTTESVSAKPVSLQDSLIATGFPHKDKSNLDSYLQTFSSIFKECRGIRRQGSAALDLAYVAAGRYDGFWESGLSRWDIAAGVIIITEAGGFITDFKGGNGFLNNGEVVAASPAIHTQMMEKISTREKKKTLKLKKD